MPQRDHLDQAPSGVFEALHRIGVAIGGVLEPIGLARLVAEHARALLVTDAAGLWVFDEQSDSLRALYLDGPWPLPDARPGDPPTMITVPLLVGGRAIGVLGVGFREPRRATKVAIDTLTLLAAEVAPALEAARLYDARVEATHRLAESEQRFRSMFDYHPDAVFALDPSGHVTLANPGCTRLSGYALDEILAEPRAYDLQTVHAQTLAFFEAALRGEPQRFDSVITHKDGRPLDVWTMHIPIVVDGQVTGVFGIARDVTESRRASEALRASEQRFRAVWEHAADAMVLSDPDGIIQDVNPACCALYGLSTEELIGQDFALILPQTGSAAAERPHRQLFAAPQPPPLLRNIVRRADGQECTVECRAEFVTEGRERVGLITIIRDITERVRAEQEREALLQGLATAQERVQQLIARVLKPTEHQVRSERRTDLEARVASLTPRERDVLRQLATGQTNQGIGTALGLSTKAARNRVADVLAKLGVADRTGAAVLAVELGLAAPLA